MNLITDASLIIAIFDEDELGDPKILTKILALGFELVIPSAVREEVYLYQAQGLDIYKHQSKIPIDKEQFTLQARYPRLGKGELEVIAYGLYLKGLNEDYLCLLDDGKARKVALDLQLKIIGTYGMLEKLFQAKMFTNDEYKSCLLKLRKSKFRLPDKIIDDRINTL